MGLAHEIATFTQNITTENVPTEVLEKAKCTLLNGYGIAVGCHNTPFAPIARKAVINMYDEVADGGATMLGDGRKVPIAGAVIANGALFHGRAQEDTCGAAHIGAVIIPLLTAILETGKYSTEDLIPAIIAGYEAGGLLETQYANYTTPGGLRATSMYGPLAAAAAAARIMKLDIKTTSAAIANVASFTGGLLQSFADGTDEWRYQVGIAAQTGFNAVNLAAAGSVSAPNAWEGKAGFIRSYTRTEPNVEELVKNLGKEWSTLKVTFKPYPVCAFNQTPVTGALLVKDMLSDKNIGLDDIDRVEIKMNPYETGYAGMDSKGPFNSISGTLMSIPFCIANTLCYGEPDMHRMTTYDDSKVNNLIKKIDLISDGNVNKLCCNIVIYYNNGQSIEHKQIMTTDDYAYDRQGVSKLIRRVGAETNLPSSIYDTLEAFADQPQNQTIDAVVACFNKLPKDL